MIADLPRRKYSVIYADPPWAYRQNGGPKGKRGMASAHYATMTTDDICKMPVREICGGGPSVSYGQPSQTSARLSRSWRLGDSSTKPRPSYG